MAASLRICSFGSDDIRSGLRCVSCLENIEQYNNNTVNIVNVAGPPQTQVGSCKTNDRKNLKNYSVN